MAISSKAQNDIDVILSHRRDLGADYWTTPDNRLMKGSPFSAYSSALSHAAQRRYSISKLMAVFLGFASDNFILYSKTSVIVSP